MSVYFKWDFKRKIQREHKVFVGGEKEVAIRTPVPSKMYQVGFRAFESLPI